MLLTCPDTALTGRALTACSEARLVAPQIRRGRSLETVEPWKVSGQPCPGLNNIPSFTRQTNGINKKPEMQFAQIDDDISLHLGTPKSNL